MSIDGRRLFGAEPKIEVRLWSLPWLGNSTVATSRTTQRHDSLYSQLHDQDGYVYRRYLGLSGQTIHLAGNFSSNLDGQGGAGSLHGFASMMKPFQSSHLTLRSSKTADQATPRRRTRGLSKSEFSSSKDSFDKQVRSESLSWNGSLRYGNFETSAQLVRPLDVEDEWHRSLACKLLVLMGRNCEMLGRNQERSTITNEAHRAKKRGTEPSPYARK